MVTVMVFKLVVLAAGAITIVRVIQGFKLMDTSSAVPKIWSGPGAITMESGMLQLSSAVPNKPSWPGSHSGCALSMKMALRYVVDSRAVDQPRVTRRENALHRFLCFLLGDVLNLGLEGSPETLGENGNEGENAEDQDGRGDHHLD